MAKDRSLKKSAGPGGRRLFALAIMFTLLLLTGCQGLPGAPAASHISPGRIVAPPQGEIPIEGQWIVREVLYMEPGEGEKLSEWLGSRIGFSGDVVVLGDSAWADASYKIKSVKALDYLGGKNTSYEGYFSEENQNVDIITVYGSGNYLCEVLAVDEKEMILFMLDAELLIEKSANRAEGFAEPTVSIKGGGEHKLGKGASGILLGLRIPEGDGYGYGTLWIATGESGLRPALYSENIFFPRKGGFWELRSYPVKGGNLLNARSLSAADEDREAAEDSIALIPGISGKTIKYIGNDFISIEAAHEGKQELRLLPVENISSPSGLRISEIMGEEGRDALHSAGLQAAEKLKKADDVRIIGGLESEESFGLVRKNGQWQMIGRIIYKKGDEVESFDYDLKISVPELIVFYDTLALSWYKIKDRVPDARDAFTSPDKDIAIIRAGNKLVVYGINPGQLQEKQMLELELNEDVEIVMAEWATGPYVEAWEKAFVSYGGKAYR